jgi:hypothetical protein
VDMLILPASLALRVEAAERLGDRKLVNQLRQRQALLARDSASATEQGTEAIEG